MKRLVPLVLALGLVAAQPALAAKQPSAGVVVAKQRGVVLVAGARGAVRVVRGTARVGSRVVVRGGRLAVTGRTRHALVRAVVVRRTGSLTFLSAAHRIFTVRSARRLAAAAPPSSTAGDIVEVEVEIDDDGDLTAQQTENVGHARAAVVQVTITAVGQGTVTVSVNGQSLTIPLPPGVTIPASAVGTQATLKLAFADEGAQAEPEDEQGDDQATEGQPAADDDEGDDQATEGQPAAGDDEGDDDQGDDDGGSTSGSSGSGSGGHHHGGDDRGGDD
jgi:hypothetical protein